MLSSTKAMAGKLKKKLVENIITSNQHFYK